MREAIDDPKVKEALKDAVAQAMKAGVCGSPFFVVDGEPFWGLDRFRSSSAGLRPGGSDVSHPDSASSTCVSW